ncbi:MAG TPA: hypothetical protein VGZ71_02360, partial [Puia sp.]|nr:hypothetical protein [Puia sp.]
FFIFKHYYKFVDSASFKPGWFFVNKVYTSRSNQFLREIDSLRRHSFFSREKLQGDIEVLYIDRFVQLEYLKLLIARVDG